MKYCSFSSLEVINGENQVFAYTNEPESVTEQTVTNVAQRSIIESATDKQVRWNIYFRCIKFASYVRLLWI